MECSSSTYYAGCFVGRIHSFAKQRHINRVCGWCGVFCAEYIALYEVGEAQSN